MSQRALAELSGVHQPTIAAVETGRRQPSDRVQKALQAALQVRPSDALQVHRDAIRALIERYHGAEVLVVGSTARGDDEVGSDLDLLVTFPPGTTDLVDLMDLMEQLEALTGIRVDIISGRGHGPVVEHARREGIAL